MSLFKNKKFIKKASIVLASTLLLGTVVQASSFTKKIDATFKGIKVFSNNEQKTLAQEPFIYNDSVYLPVRAVSELIGQTVEWDASSNSVNITKSGGSSVEQLLAQIAVKDYEIAKLQVEVSKLENEIKELKEGGKGSGSSGDLDKTLNYIKDFFDYEHSIEWDFKLSQTSSRINVDVSFDSRYDDRRWDNLTTREKENFFEDICREIRFDFKDNPINGRVIDSRTGKEIAIFNYSTRNTFSYTNTGSLSFSELEKDIKRYISNIAGADLPIDDLSIEGNEDDITFTVYVDLYDVSDERDFTYAMKNQRSDIKKTMDEIKDEILHDYRYASVQGFIEDTYSRNTVARYDGRSLYN